MKIVRVLFIFLIVPFVSLAQQKYLSGKIIDQSTQMPIPQSSLKVNLKKAGTVSNTEGKFMLLLSDIAVMDSITISSVGYKTIVRQIAQLSAEKQLTLYLEPLAFDLHEVTIQPMSIVEMLKEAIETSNSLMLTESNLNAYYKEFAYLDKKLFKYADAAMVYTVDNKGKKTKVEMHIIESRVKKDSLSAENKWKSNIESLIKPDKAVKDYYDFKYLNKFVDPKQTEKYDYQIQSTAEISKISIIAKMNVHEFLPNTTVYINVQDHRIKKVVYNYATHMEYAPSANLLILAVSVEKFNMSAIYSDGDYPFLRYCKIEQDIRFRFGGKKGLWGSAAEVLVHDVNGKSDFGKESTAVFSKRNIYKNGNDFSPDFWYKYNTLLPTEEEIKALK